MAQGPWLGKLPARFIESVSARWFDPNVARQDLLEGALLVYPTAFVWVAERYADPRRSVSMLHWSAPIEGASVAVGDDKFSLLERSLARLHVTDQNGTKRQFDMHKKAAARVVAAFDTAKKLPAGAGLDYDKISLRLNAPNQTGVPYWSDRMIRLAAGTGSIEDESEIRSVFMVAAVQEGVALYNSEGEASWVTWREMRSWRLPPGGEAVRIVLDEGIVLSVDGPELSHWTSLLDASGVHQTTEAE